MQVVTLLVSGYYESNLREEVDLLRQQIREKVDAGQLMEARQLQDLLRDKVSFQNLEPREAHVKIVCE